MKRCVAYCLMFLVLVMMFAGCNGQDDNQGQDYFVLQETESLFLGHNADGAKFLGSQYLQDEVVQFWSEEQVDEQQVSLDVYLYHEDGSSELLFGGIPIQYRSGWYTDGKRNYYVLLGDTIVKIDSDGKEVFKQRYDRTFVNLYQADNKWMAVGCTESGVAIVSELNTENGELKDKGTLPIEIKAGMYVNGQGEDIYVLNTQGLWKYRLGTEEGKCVISFDDMGYQLKGTPKGFHVEENGNLLLMQIEKNILLERVNLGETKTVVVVRNGYEIYNSKMEKYVTDFNESHENYYVVLEGKRDDEEGMDFKNRTGIELAAGKGPDIMFTGTVSDELSLMGKGAFEKLNPYIEASGLREEDFVSITFDVMRDGEDIYGVSITTQPRGLRFATEVVGSDGVTGIEDLVDSMLSYQQDAIFSKNDDGCDILKYFLQASDSMFGMIDWENKSCDFDSELFYKMLEAAKRYAAMESDTRPVISWPWQVAGIYNYTSQEENLKEGKFGAGYFFDEGCFLGENNAFCLMINANSGAKEAAWEFIEYILTGEFQTVQITSGEYPVYKPGFEMLAETEIEEGSVKVSTTGGRTTYSVKAGYSEYDSHADALKDLDNYRKNHDITRERADEIMQVLESVRPLPTRTVPILEIITEEAGAYFSGQKSVEEVCRIIENRVQLFLDEHL